MSKSSRPPSDPLVSHSDERCVTASDDIRSSEALSKLEELSKNRGVTPGFLLAELLENENSRQQRTQEQGSELSPKQKIVFEHLRNGLSTKEIAEALSIREETVRTHILRIRTRIDCPDLLSLRFM